MNIEEIEIAREIASAKGPDGGAPSGLTVLPMDHKAAKRVLALIERKAAEAEQKAAKARQAARLTKEIIDILTPEHERTSCSDENQSNAYRNEMGYPRCARCYLLCRMEYGETLASVRERVNVEVAITPKYQSKTVEVKEVIPD
jgi:chorismate mutase